MRVIYILRAPRRTDREVFCTYAKDTASNQLSDIAESVTLTLTQSPPPFFSIIPFRRDLIALITLDGVKEALWPVPGKYFAGAYLTDAAWPIANRRDWKLGDETPGVGLLTLFKRKKGISDEDFFKRWYEGHLQLTLELLPNSGYVRNHVSSIFKEAGKPGDNSIIEAWDGIVEEQYNPKEELLKPSIFFGARRYPMIPTMIRIYRDVKGFIDYSSIQSWMTQEYRIKEGPLDPQGPER